MEQKDLFDEMEEKQLPSTLNTLTILTFIGCGIGLLFGIFGFIGAEKNVANLEKTLNDPNMANMPEYLKGMINPEALELAKTQAANKIPIFILSLIGLSLCTVGAFQMRKKQLQGYYLWLIGEILPFIAMAIFVSLSVFKGWTGLIGVAFTLVFVVLYTTQRKHLK